MRRRYDHARWAGSAEDAWKHAVLSAALAHAEVERYVESHAGAGWFEVRGQARYARGVFPYLQSAPVIPPWLASWYALAGDGARLGPRYPGSWRIAAAFAPRLDLCELDPRTAALARGNAAGTRLACGTARAKAITIHETDGFAFAAAELRAADAPFVFIDPIYVGRDWEAAGALAEIAVTSRSPCLVWYPILGEVRADALLASAGGRALELITGVGRSGRRGVPKGCGLWLNDVAFALVEPVMRELEELGTALGGAPCRRHPQMPTSTPSLNDLESAL